MKMLMSMSSVVSPAVDFLGLGEVSVGEKLQELVRNGKSTDLMGGHGEA